jgi:transcription antitermination factor NusG
MLFHLDLEHRLFRVQRRLALRGKIFDVLRPVFPGYLFVNAKNYCWDLVTGVIGVVGFVKFDGKIVEVDRVVADLDAECGGTGVLPWDVESTLPARFKQGDKIRILVGSAAGCHATFERMMSHDRAIIFADWLGMKVPISIAEHEIELDVPRVERRLRRRPRRHRRLESKRNIAAAAQRL